MSFAINIAVIILEIIGLRISISERKWKIFAYYTQISNIITLVSSVFFVVSQSSVVTITLRYLSSCMLTMTFLITLFVLVPMGGGFRKLMLSGNGLYHHTLCPMLSVTSYIIWEQHSSLWILPTVLTFIYGIVMLIMNGKGLFDGPYPFFRVRNQSKLATVIWILVLIGIIAAISIGICNAAR
jgi:hypothetical protein